MTRIERNLDNQLKINHRVHNELVAKNKNVLKWLIDVTYFLGNHEVSMLEEYKSIKLDQVKAYDSFSRYIRYVLIKCVNYVVLDSIKQEVKDKPVNRCDCKL